LKMMMATLISNSGKRIRNRLKAQMTISFPIIKEPPSYPITCLWLYSLSKGPKR
jgi:hypothetical protein